MTVVSFFEIRKVYANCLAPVPLFSPNRGGNSDFSFYNLKKLRLRTGFPLILLSLREEAVSY